MQQASGLRVLRAPGAPAWGARRRPPALMRGGGSAPVACGTRPEPTGGAPAHARSSQKDALVAAQVNLIADGGLSFAVHTAPAPDDVNWPALWLGWRSRVLRTVAIVLPVAAVMVFPIGICTGARRARPPRRAAATAARSARTLSACVAAGCCPARRRRRALPASTPLYLVRSVRGCGDAEMAWLRHAVTSSGF
jgi:hypothetical protein